eukprot:1846445-Prymnesium_polylepis.1
MQMIPTSSPYSSSVSTSAKLARKLTRNVHTAVHGPIVAVVSHKQVASALDEIDLRPRLYVVHFATLPRNSRPHLGVLLLQLLVH